MCGIAGFFTAHKNEFDLAAVAARVLPQLDHRGPDDRGMVVVAEGRCALLHTRLSILDLSPAGHQPMATPDGRYWITFNGEIYNFRALRQQLLDCGEPFASQSDTEIILKLYARYGADCLAHLRGMFAFAIWDNTRQELFVARDRLGIKPVYYYAHKGQFLFASEVRALLATGLVPRQLDHIALSEYLAYQSVPAPRTLIEGVRLLPPGSWLKVDAQGQVAETRYWDALTCAEPSAAGQSYETSKRRVNELLHEAVALHLVSDVPVGAFLSGGIDSTAIVALMRATGQQPHTFSVVFNEQAFDEAHYARLAATAVGAEHTEIRLDDQRLLAELPAALQAMDQPTGDGINSYVVSQAVRSAGVKVALSGLGGDELFGGYPSFARLGKLKRYLHWWGKLPAALRNTVGNTAQWFGEPSIVASKTSALLSSDGQLAAVYPHIRQVLSQAQRQSLLTDQFWQKGQREIDPYEKLLHEALSGTQAGFMSQISYAEARTYMHDVLLRDTDQMSMAHALEVRVPLLDHKLVEYVLGLPDEHKISNGTPKRLLVESLGKLLPPEIVQRPKRGFTLPFDVWMRGELRAYCQTRLTPERIGARGIFRPAQVTRLWERFMQRRPDVSWSRLWLLVTLEEWLEQHQIEIACR
ncbi:MAG: asparagine synthase (glutamine-hydrolyzing) [Acidobacteria bacterium]|nr:asparagine synthase (glutamine-hydrolyzing) [Acidobacteriota bacterium]MBI3425570.1 asparagine synthase (glutamine-hydrolyzing) [Acidobacteriota bacterium]